MKIISIVILILTSFASFAQIEKNKKKPVMSTPPVAQKIPHEITTHGDTRIDNYYWMRLSDEQKNAEEANRDAQTNQVLGYLNAENAYTNDVMAHTDKFQKDLFSEMKGRIKETDQSVPVKNNGYWYYSRFEAGQNYAYNCRKKESLETGQEEILIDGPKLAEGKDYWAVGSYDISENNKLMCYGVDIVSRRIYTVYFKNLETGEMLADVLEGTSGGAAWANDNKTVFYTKKDPVTLRDNQIWRHEIGTAQDKDVLVFEEKDEEFSCFVYKTKSKKFMVIGSNQTLSTEYRVLDADHPAGEFKIIQPRERNHEYGIDHYGDKFYIVTNWNAKNFRLMETSVDATSKENWKEIIAHRDNVLLEGITI
ncbi:MAG: hypothetical protein RL204_342, partial [Bacteroidota bacterium]